MQQGYTSNPKKVDFFRSTAANALPDGTTDETEGIWHDGAVHVGNANISSLTRFTHFGIASYTGNGSFQNQVILTKIPKNSTIMPTIRIVGYQYGGADTIDILVSLYTYNAPSGAIRNAVWQSQGTINPTSIRAGWDASGLLALEINWPSVQDYTRYEVSSYCDGNGAGQRDTWFEAWAVSATTFDATYTQIVTVTRKYAQALPVLADKQRQLQLDGKLMVSRVGEVRWTNTFITISAGTSVHTPNGHHRIPMPADGAAIPVAGGGTRAVVAATAAHPFDTGGILLNAWESLWVRLTKGSSAPIPVPANLLIQPYTAASGVEGINLDASEWVLLAARNDDSAIKLGSGGYVFPGWHISQSVEATTAVYDGLKASAVGDGIFFTGFSAPSPTVFGFTGSIRYINGGSGAYLSSYVDLTQAQKTAGTTVYGYGGEADRTWRLALAADGLALHGGNATAVAVQRIDPAVTTVVDLANSHIMLYWAPTIETGVSSGQWVVSNHTANSAPIPPHWIPIARRQTVSTNSTIKVMLPNGANLRAGDSAWMGQREGAIDMLHRRMGLQFNGLAHCRFTHSGFFAGAATNGLFGNATGVLVSWDDNTLRYGISDGYASWGDQHTWINMPPDGTQIPFAHIPATTITRQVITIGGRRFIPMSIWEKLWYIPPYYAGGNVSSPGGFVATYYGSNNQNVPPGAILIASMAANIAGTGTGKTKVKFADGYIQPGMAWASATAANRALYDQAHGTGDWRPITVAGQTGPGMTAPMPNIAGTVGPYPAPYSPEYRYCTNASDPRGTIELHGLIQMNANVTAVGAVVGFMAGVAVRATAIETCYIANTTRADAQMIPVQVRFSAATMNGQSGTRIQLTGSAADPAQNPYFTLGLSGAAQAAGTSIWLNLGSLSLHHA